MQFVKESAEDEVLILRLSRAKANALNLHLVEELNVRVQRAETEEVRALVIGSAQPRFFSAGFDVVDVFAYDRPTMRHFFGRFMNLYERLLRFPKPVVCALSGHAFAGGAFLALTSDARIMAKGKARFALNEIDLGTTVPRSVRRTLINLVGAGEASRMILTGNCVEPHRALRSGASQQAAVASGFSAG